MSMEKLAKEGGNKIIVELQAIWDQVGDTNVELRKINANLHNLVQYEKKRLELLENAGKRRKEKSLGDVLEDQGAPVKKKCSACGESISYDQETCEYCRT